MRMWRAGVAAVVVLSATPMFAMAETPAAVAAPPSARQLQLAQQILDETGMTRNFDTMMRDLFARLGDQSAAMVGDAPGAKARSAILNDAMTAAVLKVKPQLLQMSAEVYAQTFTEAELQGMLEFYRTPIGRAMAEKTPTLTRNLAAATGRLMPEMLATMSEELCARAQEMCVRKPPPPAPKAPKT